jgi:hypothetical protein
LSSNPTVIDVSSDAIYSIGTAALIIAILWLLGVIKPASLQAPLPQQKRVAKQRQRPVANRPKPQQQPTEKIDDEPVIHLEEEEIKIEPEEDISEIQESLIEIEEAEPEPPEEELDEFELRLRRLRKNRE